jgi:chondroitin AC lyase
LLISSYSSGKVGLNSGGFVPEKKTAKEIVSPDLEIVRKRIIADLLEPAIDGNKINQLVKSIRPDGSWPGINYKDTTKTGFQHSIHLENMLDLARAYKKPGTKFYQNNEVKKAVSSALDFWIAHDFICENWWWNEMGTPNWMINTLLLLDNDLTDNQRNEGIRIAGRASLTGVGARAGGDFVPIAGMVCKQGLFKRDEGFLKNAIKVMAAQIKITTDRGIKPDMSFHHRVDNVISIHTYGTNYVSSFAYWAVKFSGTKFNLPDTALNLLIDYYLDGVCKAMAYEKYPDPGAMNRDLSRKGTLHPSGTEIPQNLMQATDYRKKELENIVQIRRGETPPDLSWSRYFWNSSYFSHQRKNYFASVRMYSSRQNNMEEPYNEEGLKNHHFADGSNFISRTGKEYVDIFPVWDWQKIPGTTVVQKPSLPPSGEIAKKGLSDYVGGVTDGEFGAAAFDFKSVHDPLKARKSWFFFHQEYICLGAGISSEADYPVATTLNQCLLNKNIIVKTKNGLETLNRGQHSLKGVSWIIHDSVAYLFPTPTAIHITNTTATGNWRQINHQAWATVEPVQKDVFTLWLNHGMKPQNAHYQYIVVPGIEASSIDSYNKTSGITILSNTPEIQAVQHKGLNRTEIVFYKAGSIKISSGIIVKAESPCMVMIKTNGKRIEKIAASDPTQKLKSLQLSVNLLIEAKGNHWQSTWNKEKKTSIITIDLPTEGYAGQSVVLNLNNKKAQIK